MSADPLGLRKGSGAMGMGEREEPPHRNSLGPPSANAPVSRLSCAENGEQRS